MRKRVVMLLFLCAFGTLAAQPNCYVYQDDAECFEACETALKAIRYPQGSFESQQYFDKSIELCSTIAYSHMEKAVPFLKRGLFVEWKKMIDKAVELAPKEYLGYRAWCRLQFLRDYDGAITDIELLKSMVSYDIGDCQTGDYHLNIALAICYKEIGEIEKSRSLFLEHLNSTDHSPGLYDYYSLAVLENEAGNYELSLDYLKKQIERNDYMAESYYYLALNYFQLGDCTAYSKSIARALRYYEEGKIMSEPYSEPFDKVYLDDILLLEGEACKSMDH